MVILQKPVPTTSYRAWEVIGGDVFHHLLVQQRTQRGLTSNNTLYHRLLYKKHDHVAFRIIYSVDPLDFIQDGPSAASRVRAKSSLRLVLAVAQTRDEILREWEKVKDFRSSASLQQASQMLESWSTFQRFAPRASDEVDSALPDEVCSSITSSETDEDGLVTPKEIEDDSGADQRSAPFGTDAAIVSAPLPVKRASEPLLGKIPPWVAMTLFALGVAWWAAAGEGVNRSFAFGACLATLACVACHGMLLRSLHSTTSRETALTPVNVHFSTTLLPVASSEPAVHRQETSVKGSAERVERWHLAPEATTDNRPVCATTEGPTQLQQHHRYNIKIVDLCSGVAHPPNVAPFSVKSDFFEGFVYAKVVTDPREAKLEPYFSGKRRRFEIQLQGRLRFPPHLMRADGTLKGFLCFAAGIPTKMQMSMTLRTMGRLIVSVFSKLTRGATVTLGNESEDALPAFTSHAAHAMDALIESEDFESAPKLGVPMLPDTGDLARMRNVEKKLRACPFIHNKVYSCSFHSQYADFDSWRMVNVPGISTMDLHRFWGSAPLRVGLYLLAEGQSMGTAMRTAVPVMQIEIHHRSLPTFVSCE